MSLESDKTLAHCSIYANHRLGSKSRLPFILLLSFSEPSQSNGRPLLSVLSQLEGDDASPVYSAISKRKRVKSKRSGSTFNELSGRAVERPP